MMIMFFETLENPVYRALLGVWRNEVNKYEFTLKGEINQVEMVLLIDDVEKGKVSLEFSAKGRCSILLNNEKAFEIASIFLNPVTGAYTIRLRDGGVVVELKLD